MENLINLPSIEEFIVECEIKRLEQHQVILEADEEYQALEIEENEMYEDIMSVLSEEYKLKYDRHRDIITRIILRNQTHYYRCGSSDMCDAMGLYRRKGIV